MTIKKQNPRINKLTGTGKKNKPNEEWIFNIYLSFCKCNIIILKTIFNYLYFNI